MLLDRRALIAAAGAGLCGLASPRRAKGEAAGEPVLMSAADGIAALVAAPTAPTPVLAYDGLAESGVLRYRPGAEAEQRGSKSIHVPYSYAILRKYNSVFEFSISCQHQHTKHGHAEYDVIFEVYPGKAVLDGILVEIPANNDAHDQENNAHNHDDLRE